MGRAIHIKCIRLYWSVSLPNRCTSIHEGLPIVLIEAQAAGLKCFISDNITEQIDCGGCFRISLDKTVEEWADIILEEIKKNPVAHIQKDKIEKYSIQYTVKELEKIYNER